jgi:hypothetical protein
MHPSSAHSRRTRWSVGSTWAIASRRNAFGGSEMARNGSETHEKRLYSPLTPATDVGQPFMPWGGVGGGLRWPSVVVSEHAFERAPRRGPFFFNTFESIYYSIYLFFGSRFLFIPKHQFFPTFRGTWYLLYHIVGKTLWYEVLVTTGTSLWCINGRKWF